MFKRMVVAAALILALTVGGGAWKASAQESSTPKAPETPKPLSAYRIDFSLNELEDGKKINTRQYSMNLQSDDQNEIKIGTKVPFEQKKDEFQYVDVGTSIFCRIGIGRAPWEKGVELPEGIPLSVRAEVSSFARPEQERTSSIPELRQLQIKASTIAQLGKPMIVGSVDDPNSKRQFQLEVTVTKLR